MSKLVIFGNREMAELVHFYFSKDTEYKVSAFSVDGAFIKESTFLGLPVVPFEELAKHYPPEENKAFVALSYAKLNVLRRKKYFEMKAAGYELASYICSKASWWHENSIGDNTLILENVIIQPFVSIGNNVFIWSGNHIGHHTQIKDHTFITSQVVIGGGAVIGEECFVGINATIRDHITIGDRCIIGASAIVMKDTEPDGLYVASSTKRSATPASKIDL
ncbi:MAG: acetyltransferase [Candidatus Obscuribacterales bacterium]|jgi:sugar O-acyltransferase (sialic acid O-acetyltransferase NeuD family)